MPLSGNNESNSIPGDVATREEVRFEANFSDFPDKNQVDKVCDKAADEIADRFYQTRSTTSGLVPKKTEDLSINNAFDEDYTPFLEKAGTILNIVKDGGDLDTLATGLV